MRFIYNFLIYCYLAAIWLAAPFVPKAKKWLAGRQNWRQNLRQNFPKTRPVFWLHAASLGEFEQGRPLLEAFRREHPDWQILLTFFSPSGFEVRRDFPLADHVCYLPADTPANARDFLEIVRPDVAVFVKYEFWANHLGELRRRGCPTLLVSAIFREGQLFFQFWGGFWRQMLGCFEHIFVQNQNSLDLLQRIGFQNVSLAGDTRIDRVLAIAETAQPDPIAAAFCAQAERVLVAGSTWPADEAVILPCLDFEKSRYKLIIAPHDPARPHVEALEKFLKKLGCPAVRYSQAKPETVGQFSTLIIDNVGLLNRLYRHATLVHIGGGFGKGIHNTLEAAAWGVPITFGPNFQKFEEARQLLACGAAFSVENTGDFEKILEKMGEPTVQRQAGQAAKNWLLKNQGATERILEHLKSLVARPTRPE